MTEVFNFLWNNLGQHIITVVNEIHTWLSTHEWIEWEPPVKIRWYWLANPDEPPPLRVRLIGVGLAIFLVYIVGLFIGNLIGRTTYRLIEKGVMRIPFVRAVYPAVKQVTDLFLGERKGQFEASRVVAVQPHAGGIWSIGLVTGGGLRPLSEVVGEDMVTVFVPSSPTAFSGYVMVVPRPAVVELPMTVEEAMRLLVSGGVISPESAALPPSQPAIPAPSSADRRIA